MAHDHDNNTRRISAEPLSRSAVMIHTIIDEQKPAPRQKHLKEALWLIERTLACELTDDQSEALRLIKERYYKNQQP